MHLLIRLSNPLLQFHQRHTLLRILEFRQRFRLELVPIFQLKEEQDVALQQLRHLLRSLHQELIHQQELYELKLRLQFQRALGLHQ